MGVTTNHTFIKPLNFKMTSCLLCLSFWTNFAGHSKFHFAISRTLIGPLSFGLCSWCLNSIQLFSKFREPTSYKNKFLLRLLENSTLIEPLSFGICSWCLNFIQPFPKCCESQSYKIKLYLQFLQNKHEHLTSKSISRRPISGDKFLSSSKLIIFLFKISSSLEREYGMSNCLAGRNFP